MKIAVVAPEVPENLKNLINLDEYTIYACDNAVSELIKQNVTIDLAVGDFDSLENLDVLKGIKTIKLSKLKDDSDTSYALRHAYQMTNDVILVGGIKGNRSDHFLANLFLLEKYPNLVIIDDTNKIKRLEKGTYPIKKENYDYLSIFPLEDIKITLTGVVFSLIDEELSQYDVIGLSNEIKHKYATLDLSRGVILLIQSKRK